MSALLSKGSLGVCVIGAGFMGKCHSLAWNAVAATYGDVPKPRLEILVERDPDYAKAKARQLGFPRWTTDWREAIRDPAIDVVSITTHKDLHSEMAIAALECGKHVWCEKPMSDGIEGAERMAAVARRSPSVTALGFNFVQNPVIRLIKKIIESNEIGAIRHVRLEMDEDFMADKRSESFLRHHAPSGGVIFPEFAVHPLSILQVTIGDIFNVFAVEWPDNNLEGEDPRDKGDNIAAAMFSMTSGASGTLALCRSAWGRKGRIFLQVFGTRGTIIFDQERLNEVQVFTADGPAETRGFRTVLAGTEHPPYAEFVSAPGHGLGFNDLKVMECRELLHAIDGRPAHLIDFEGGLRIERAVEAFQQSSIVKEWRNVANS